ncbi:methyltransferase domain-containing protein [Pradoshia sp.]
MSYNTLTDFLLSKVNWSQVSAVLDIGCGYGHQLIQMGELARSDVKLVGLDKMETCIAHANDSTKGDHRYTFKTADLSQPLPFDDHTFDLVFSKDVLECIVDKASLLQELHRVLKPGGQIVMAHYDFDTQVFDGNNKALVRKMVQAYSDWEQAWMDDSDGWIGRRLWKYINSTGLFSGSMDSFVLIETTYKPGDFGYNRVQDFQDMIKKGFISESDYLTFKHEMEELAKEDQYLFSINSYVYSGVGK